MSTQPAARFVALAIAICCSGPLDAHAAPAVAPTLSPAAVGNVVTYTGPSATGSGDITVTFTGGNAECTYAAAAFLPITEVSVIPPAGVGFPHGLFGGYITGCEPGTVLTFTITYPEALPQGAQFWNFSYSDGGHWYEQPAVLSGSQVSFTLADNGFGDNDPADGTLMLVVGPSALLKQVTFKGPSATGTGEIIASFSGGGDECRYATAQFVPPPDGAPARDFSQGLFSFTTSGCTPGAALNFTITYPQAISPLAAYWVHGHAEPTSRPGWFVIPVTVTGNQAVFTITDGGHGDDDHIANGSIVNTGGPAQYYAVPLLAPPVLIALCAGLFGIGAARLRRGRA